MFDTFLTLFDSDGVTVLAACDDCDATGKSDSCGPCCMNGMDVYPINIFLLFNTNIFILSYTRNFQHTI